MVQLNKDFLMKIADKLPFQPNIEHTYLTRLRCRLFHKKAFYSALDFIRFPMQIRVYGCKKCDLWRICED